jgi:leucyl-tRNA synthetase
VDKEGNQIAGYRKQLDKNDSLLIESWSPYFKSWLLHTQWIFIQLFNSWYNKNSDKAEDTTLTALFEKENATVNAVCDENIDPFQPKNGTLSQRYSEKTPCNTDWRIGDGS